jgi:predicted acylesterase/phospholipase RssA
MRRAVAPLLVLALAGCFSLPTGEGVRSPVHGGLNPAELVDPAAQAEADQLLDLNSLYQMAERVRAERRPAVPPPKRSVLVLSGGGAFGAYSAGVLVGWTEAGTRPEFDVVTGISTGALIAPLAFLGPEHDDELRQMYTTLRNDDLFRLKFPIDGLFSASLADNAPLARKVESIVTSDFLRKVAAEHAKGRRLYVGTTELESRRQVVWDLGAIAARGSPHDLGLFRRVLLASAAIPGFFPPIQIPIAVEGQLYEECHVDGGVSASLFFRPPWVPPERRGDPAAASLHGSDLFVIVAGKLFPDPDPVKPNALTIAGKSVSALIHAQTRGDLGKLYLASILTGMNYRLAAIPADFPTMVSSTDFDPVEMTKLFEEGVRRARAGTAWRATPPGLEKGEAVSQRQGVQLVRSREGEAN